MSATGRGLRDELSEKELKWLQAKQRDARHSRKAANKRRYLRQYTRRGGAS